MAAQTHEVFLVRVHAPVEPGARSEVIEAEISVEVDLLPAVAGEEDMKTGGRSEGADE